MIGPSRSRTTKSESSPDLLCLRHQLFAGDIHLIQIKGDRTSARSFSGNYECPLFNFPEFMHHLLSREIAPAIGDVSLVPALKVPGTGECVEARSEVLTFDSNPADPIDGGLDHRALAIQASPILGIPAPVHLGVGGRDDRSAKRCSTRRTCSRVVRSAVMTRFQRLMKLVKRNINRPRSAHSTLASEGLCRP